LTKVIVEVCLFPLSSSTGEVKVSLFPTIDIVAEPPLLSSQIIDMVFPETE